MHILKNTILFLLLSITVDSSFGQGYYNNWYFGYYAGLDFNTKPVSTTKGQTYHHEGNATISDSNGNLLFYTDGISVWNAKHIKMKNGTELKGSGTSTQSALIVPNPADKNQYYIFTTPAPNYPDYASTFSIVDMTLDGGLGDVTSSKNIILHSTSTERITAVRFPDSTGFWIIGHEPDNTRFFAYKLTKNGIERPAIISAIGCLQSGSQKHYSGYLKASHKGNKLAMASYNLNLFELFNFNNITGVVSNVIPFYYNNAFGVEFSPDDSRLYLGGGFGSAAYLYQINLDAGNANEIINSAKLITSGYSEIGYRSLQLGPDCRIYVSDLKKDNLGIINNPNALGNLCDFIDNQLILNNGTYGNLPNFFEMTCCNIPKVNIGNDTILCEGETITLDATTAHVSYIWQDNSNQPTFTVHKKGQYWVTLSNGKCSISDSINVDYNSIPYIYLGEDTILCDGNSLNLSVKNKYSTYLWQDSSIKSTFTISKEGIYWVNVTNQCGTTTDSIQVNYIELPEINLGKDTTLCDGDTIILDATIANGFYHWQDNSTNPTYKVKLEGQYWITVFNGKCSNTDTIFVEFFSKPIVDLGKDTILCNGSYLNLNLKNKFSTFLWQDNSISPDYQIIEEGVYWVKVTNNCGTNTDSIIVGVKDCTCSIYFPNAFTPNNDELNDLFTPISNCTFSEFLLKIYNRWGEKIFETTDPSISWDATYKGHLVPVGVYIYSFTYKFQSETNKSGHGTVTVIK